MMKTFKLFLALSYLAVSIFSSSAQFNNDQKVYFKSVKCNVSEKFVYPNVSCFAKSFSRTISTMNVYMIFKTGINFSSEGNLLFKYGQIYREVMNSKRMNWCRFMDGTESNLMMTQLISIYRDSNPSFIHKCPYSEITIRNSTINTSSMMSIFSTGDYKMNILLFKGEEEFARIALVMNLITPNKDSFG